MNELAAEVSMFPWDRPQKAPLPEGLEGLGFDPENVDEDHLAQLAEKNSARRGPGTAGFLQQGLGPRPGHG